jgi:hypothetical protein
MFYLGNHGKLWLNSRILREGPKDNNNRCGRSYYDDKFHGMPP